MKLTLTTTYEDFNEEWLAWYLERLKAGPEETRQVAMILKSGDDIATFSTKNEEVIATTTYRLDRSKNA